MTYYDEPVGYGSLPEPLPEPEEMPYVLADDDLANFMSAFYDSGGLETVELYDGKYTCNIWKHHPQIFNKIMEDLDNLDTFEELEPVIRLADELLSTSHPQFSHLKDIWKKLIGEHPKAVDQFYANKRAEELKQ